MKRRVVRHERMTIRLGRHPTGAGLGERIVRNLHELERKKKLLEICFMMDVRHINLSFPFQCLRVAA